MDYIYPEICVPRARGKSPDFPLACPVCGAGIVTQCGDPYPIYDHMVFYSCGGSYKRKPQIQTHTYKFWGFCPKTKISHRYT